MILLILTNFVYCVLLIFLLWFSLCSRYSSWFSCMWLVVFCCLGSAISLAILVSHSGNISVAILLPCTCVIKVDVLVLIFCPLICFLCFWLDSRLSAWLCGNLNVVAFVVKVDVPVFIFIFCWFACSAYRCVLDT